MMDVTSNFLNCIVTDDKVQCLRHDSETKRQSLEWRSPALSHRKKVGTEKWCIKTMLTSPFFDRQGISTRGSDDECVL
ncbi:hypothetical protein TNIN_488241 [Trichonephila inaurata madagascariensis]|uniref:Uncharacterized protein n=1 Tax=Trichonephila inaurata madagascariensis TaxID=2747483 RepID=A0A8X7C2V9_9ARAC|nr:hypothetical protein TNIN_488241 [Trichonephila inaurata madagascariensis]